MGHYCIVLIVQVTREWSDDVHDFVSEGKCVDVKVINVNCDKYVVILSLRQCAYR